ncbi:cbb3-type cytochrome oxidase subunit 3 [Oceanibaculum pacificum]|uniref:Cytochrome oxidase n=1 Tax=Oceanibaculum pacificum TaxID=580166 RepID=A0A154VWZ3_9PROT|nr:cbb3-type cytochrome c oxidase subunit 3 [Oceanibaculum pacificum]KZD05826.1 cytochrome oxidase [Oceanibaculum pacificum]
MDIFQELAGALRHYWGLWLMLIFLGMILWTVRPGAGKRYRDASRIPLNDETPRQESKD